MNLGYYIYKDFLRVFVEMLKENAKGGLLSVVLYGSVAKGRAKPSSDIDLLILYRKSENNLNEIYPEIVIKARETKEYEELIKEGIFVEISPYLVTVEELKENPLILLDIIDEGIVLYDKDESFKYLMEKFREKIKELGSRKVFLPDGSYYWELKPDWRPGEVVEIKI